VICSRRIEINHGGLADFHRKGQREITLGKEEKGKSARAREGMDILPPKGRRLVFKTKVRVGARGIRGSGRIYLPWASPLKQ